MLCLEDNVLQQVMISYICYPSFILVFVLSCNLALWLLFTEVTSPNASVSLQGYLRLCFLGDLVLRAPSLSFEKKSPLPSVLYIDTSV